MKKAISWMVVITLLFIILIYKSFMNAQDKANKIRDTFVGNLSELKGSLVLFESEKFRPYWSFNAEYTDLMTGATFDIDISIFGKVIRQPPKTKKIQ